MAYFNKSDFPLVVADFNALLPEEKDEVIKISREQGAEAASNRIAELMIEKNVDIEIAQLVSEQFGGQTA